MINKFLGLYTTANNNTSIITGNGLLSQVAVYASGATTTATLWDTGGTTAAGNRLVKVTVRSNQSRVSENWGDGLEYEAGLFLQLTGAGGECKVEIKKS